MKPTLTAGVTATATIDVDRPRTIDFMGENARVYATPDARARHRDDRARPPARAPRSGRGLGRHAGRGRSPRGARCSAAASTLKVTVAEVKGRAVALDVEGRDGVDTICRGRHHRFVVDVKATEARLAAKAAKAGLVRSRDRHDRTRPDVLLPVRRGAGPAHRQGRGRRRHRGRAQLLRGRRAPRRRQGLREGLRSRAEDLQPEPRADADEAHQPEQGTRRGPGVRADLVGRGARSRRREAERGARRRPDRRLRLSARRGRASAAAARRSRTWARSPRSSPRGARSTWASARARASSATTRSTCTASSGTARSPSRRTRRSATT